jgi:quercetin dioxygenase-like cupin family protein
MKNPSESSPAAASDIFVFDADQPWRDAGLGVRRKILGHDGQLMAVRFAFEGGGVGALHSHPHRQTSVIASGVFDVTISGRTERLRAGDCYIVPPNAVHGAVCIEAGDLIDSFTPARADFF